MLYRIRMLHTCMGSEDGHGIRLYQRGREYTLPELLACHLLKKRVAELARLEV